MRLRIHTWGGGFIPLLLLAKDGMARIWKLLKEMAIPKEYLAMKVPQKSMDLLAEDWEER